jgi:hypothetical protein
MAVPFACWLFSFRPERRDATGFHLWNRAERKWFTCFVSKNLSVLYGAHSGGVPVARTDEQGHYCLRKLPLGDYDMTADDPDKGYPSMTSGFFSTTPLRSRVSLSATDLNGQADWQIPYRAGFVGVELVDAQSGKPIVPMFFDLVVQSRPEVGHMYGSTASTTALLVPPNEDVIVTIHASGYREDSDKEPQRTVVNLLPGETKELHIALRDYLSR